MRTKDYALFFVCSLIEFIGRLQKLKRSEVVNALGRDKLGFIYEMSDVLHCEPVAKVADDYIQRCQIPTGTFDNVATCQYDVPDYWTMGEVFERLIEDVMTDNPIDTLIDIYHSWICDALCCYNSDFFYQPRDYIKACWDAGEVLDD